MGTNARFGEILEEAAGWPVEDQETLVEVLQNRLRERRREELANDVREAQKEFEAGSCRPATANELIRDRKSVV